MICSKIKERALTIVQLRRKFSSATTENETMKFPITGKSFPSSTTFHFIPLACYLIQACWVNYKYMHIFFGWLLARPRFEPQTFWVARNGRTTRLLLILTYYTCIVYADFAGIENNKLLTYYCCWITAAVSGQHFARITLCLMCVTIKFTIKQRTRIKKRTDFCEVQTVCCQISQWPRLRYPLFFQAALVAVLRTTKFCMKQWQETK